MLLQSRLTLSMLARPIVAVIACAIFLATVFGGGGDTHAGQARIAIVSPSEKQTIHDNTGRLRVRLDADVGAAQRHGNRIRVILDGEVIGPLRSSLSFDLDNIVRGEHQLQVQLVDAAGGVIASSDPVTFYMWQGSRLF